MIGRGNNGERERSMRLLLRGVGGTEIGIVEGEEEEEEEVTAIREGGTTMTIGKEEEEEAGRDIRTTAEQEIVTRRGGGRGVRISEARRRLGVTSIRGGANLVYANTGILNILATRIGAKRLLVFSGFSPLFADRATST